MTQLVALHSVLRPGSEAAHDVAHERIPDELIIGDYVDHIEATPAGESPLPLVWRRRDQASSQAV
jgi:hypothetical protein